MMQIITTQRFKLKEIQPSDINDIYKGLSNPEVTKHYGVHFSSIEATQAQMTWYSNLRTQNTGIWWGIYTKEKGEFCGAGGYNNLDSTHKKAEIGFWLLPEYWGQGIMTEVMPRIFQEGFKNLGLNRIEGFVESDNIKCKRGLEKINFTYEGTMRACEIKDDKFIDIDFYAILRQDWK